jgi:hypothetical protein
MLVHTSRSQLSTIAKTLARVLVHLVGMQVRFVPLIQQQPLRVITNGGRGVRALRRSLVPSFGSSMSAD